MSQVENEVKTPDQLLLTLPARRFTALVKMLKDSDFLYLHLKNDSEGLHYTQVDTSHHSMVRIFFTTRLSEEFGYRGVIDVEKAYKLRLTDGLIRYDATGEKGKLFLNGHLIYEEKEALEVSNYPAPKFSQKVSFRIGLHRLLNAISAAENITNPDKDGFLLKGDTVNVYVSPVDYGGNPYATIPLYTTADGSFDRFAFSYDVMPKFLKGLLNFTGDTTLKVSLLDNGCALIETPLPMGIGGEGSTLQYIVAGRFYDKVKPTLTPR